MENQQAENQQQEIEFAKEVFRDLVEVMKHLASIKKVVDPITQSVVEKSGADKGTGQGKELSKVKQAGIAMKVMVELGNSGPSLFQGLQGLAPYMEKYAHLIDSSPIDSSPIDSSPIDSSPNE